MLKHVDQPPIAKRNAVKKKRPLIRNLTINTAAGLSLQEKTQILRTGRPVGEQRPEMKMLSEVLQQQRNLRPASGSDLRNYNVTNSHLYKFRYKTCSSEEDLITYSSYSDDALSCQSNFQTNFFRVKSSHGRVNTLSSSSRSSMSGCYLLWENEFYNNHK